ncbi:unnamed protein product, partial [Rotaria sp. Silwood2]
LSQLTGPVTNKQPEYNEISNDKNEFKNNELLPNNNDTLYEAISDDDNEKNLSLPSYDNDLHVNNNDMVDGVSDYEQQQSFNKKLQLYRGTRSDDARKQRNRKRNLYFQIRR